MSDPATLAVGEYRVLIRTQGERCHAVIFQNNVSVAFLTFKEDHPLCRYNATDLEFAEYAVKHYEEGKDVGPQ